jgi:cellulose synthase/poly-beta-1,6-N-acetylglucosamine synthase-like glycosyltransferase
MTIFLILLLFIGVAGLAFPYVGYPGVLKILGKYRSSGKNSPGQWPRLSVIIPVYNGAEFIEAKIADIYHQDYPGELEIIVASDASNDGGDEIVRGMQEKHGDLKLLRLPLRQGKSAAQNAALKKASGDILIFTDATVTLGEQALARIVDEFRDPTVGCVSGEDRSVASDDGDHSAGAGVYSRFEVWLRRLEVERTGTLIGVSGCLFGVRRFLRPEVPLRAVDDLYIPLHVVARGFRVVIAEGAVANVKRTVGLKVEFHRKIRTFTGAFFSYFASVRSEKPLGLRRVRLHLAAHKMMRWFAPFFAFAALISAAGLANTHCVFSAILTAQIFFYWLGIAGIILALRNTPQVHSSSLILKILGRMTRLSAFFVIVLISLSVAWLRWIFNKPFVTWAPTQRV